MRRIKPQPVSDPASHAGGKVLRVTGDWVRCMTFFTTGRFAPLERGFHQNCGPTALTNVICTLKRRAGEEMPEAEQVFRTVADTGRRRVTYWNVPEKYHLGGTSYLLLRGYLAASLRRFGCRARLHGPILAGPRRLAEELEKGRLLCLGLVRHPCYGSHVVVAYGTVAVEVPGKAEPALYFRLADGWSQEPRYLPAESFRACVCVSLEPEK